MFATTGHGVWYPEYANLLTKNGMEADNCVSKAVVWLACVLATGFLLLILSCTLWSNWYPLLVGAYAFLALPTSSLLSKGRSKPRSSSLTNRAADLPLSTGLLFVLPPIPNSLCGRLAGYDDYAADYNPAFADLGDFFTAVMVVSGAALPLTLAHAGILAPAACGMAIAGGGLVYSTMVTYHTFFSQEDDNLRI